MARNDNMYEHRHLDPEWNDREFNPESDSAVRVVEASVFDLMMSMMSSMMDSDVADMEIPSRDGYGTVTARLKLASVEEAVDPAGGFILCVEWTHPEDLDQDDCDVRYRVRVTPEGS